MKGPNALDEAGASHYNPQPASGGGRSTQLVKFRPALRYAFWQSAALAILLLVVTLGFDRQTAWSAGIGALIAYLGQLYLTVLTFRISARQEPQRAVQNFYRGVAGRLALVTLLFAAAFYRLAWLEAPALFLGFGVILVAQIMGSARLATELGRINSTGREDEQRALNGD